MDLHFRNGKFTILQVSDAQDLHFVRRTMLWMLDKAYNRVRPDLIVLTGDNILGNHLRDARFGTKQAIHTKEEEHQVMKTAIDRLMAPIARRGIPFAMIYGNHDDRNGHTKEEQAMLYRAYPGCIGLEAGESGLDCDTYNVPIFGADGKICFNLWMIDSAWYDREADRCFESVKPETVSWFRRESEKLKKENDGKAVPSLVFLHIPLPETQLLTEKCAPDDSGAVHDGDKIYRLKSDCLGELGEQISVCEDNGFFEAIKENGGVRAVVSGHDHRNCFDGMADGVRFIATPAASFRCYGDRKRGVRVFSVDEKTGAIETQAIHYAELCGRGVLAELRYLWDADGCEKQKTALIAGGIGALAGGMTLVLRRKK